MSLVSYSFSISGDREEINEIQDGEYQLHNLIIADKKYLAKYPFPSAESIIPCAILFRKFAPAFSFNKPLNKKLEVALMVLSLALVAYLMLIAFYNDIVNLLTPLRYFGFRIGRF